MASEKETKTVNLEKRQIDEIEKLNADHPFLQKRGFSWITRWLIDKGLIQVEQGGDSDQDTH
jgi:hypothetical protein